MIDPDTGQPQRNPTDVDIDLSTRCSRSDATRPTLLRSSQQCWGPPAWSDSQRATRIGPTTSGSEQHAATSAVWPTVDCTVVAVYATFLNRAFDQVLMDCALHNAGVTFVLDRAGVTGDDGPSHNGMWDMAMLGVVPGLHLAAPRDESTLRRALRESIAISDAPSVVRFAKGALGPDIPAVRAQGGVDVLFDHDQDEVDVLVVAIGSFCSVALDVAATTRSGSRPVSSTHGGRYRSPRTSSR